MSVLLRHTLINPHSQTSLHVFSHLIKGLLIINLGHGKQGKDQQDSWGQENCGRFHSMLSSANSLIHDKQLIRQCFLFISPLCLDHYLKIEHRNKQKLHGSKAACHISADLRESA